MRTTLAHGVLGISLFVIGCATAATRPSPDTECRVEPSPIAYHHFRDKRYCEILLIRGVGTSLTGCVYNTICDNDCPPARWSALDAEKLKKQLDATEVILNGPRHFVMDTFAITEGGKEKVNFDGVVMCAGAAMDLKPGTLVSGQQPFTETAIDRTTEWVYFKDRPVFLLLSPDRAAYLMQSYSQIVDPNLSYRDLPTLGEHMKLPPGWKYVSVTPKSDLRVKSHGTAHVLQDELQNTYQRLGTEEWEAIRDLVH